MLALQARPELRAEGGAALDLYQGIVEGRRLRPNESVISADAKSQLQALGRRLGTLPSGPGRRG